MSPDLHLLQSLVSSERLPTAAQHSGKTINRRVHRVINLSPADDLGNNSMSHSYGRTTPMAPSFFVLEDEVACCLHVNMEY